MQKPTQKRPAATHQRILNSLAIAAAALVMMALTQSNVIERLYEVLVYGESTLLSCF